jgi:hypothetical protein
MIGYGFFVFILRELGWAFSEEIEEAPSRHRELGRAKKAANRIQKVIYRKKI